MTANRPRPSPGDGSRSRASAAPLRVLTMQRGISLVALLVRTDSLRCRVQNFVDAVCPSGAWKPRAMPATWEQRFLTALIIAFAALVMLVSCGQLARGAVVGALLAAEAGA